MKRLNIDRTQIKLMAMVFMVFDHIPWLLWDMDTNLNILSGNYLSNIMHMLGRMVFPIFAFFISEGFIYTRHKKAYLKRVGLLAIISIVPFGLYFGRYFGL